MLFMVIETFKPGAVQAIYRRAHTQGRMLPAGVTYVDSWVTADLRRCFQLMECQDQRQLDAWIEHWADLTDFEVIPVVSSAEAAARVLATLDDGGSSD